MAESPKKCKEKVSTYLEEKTLSSPLLWYFLFDELDYDAGFAFTLNAQDPDEIVMLKRDGVVCCDTFPKQLVYCEYLKAIHWIEDHSEPMKRKKWNSLCYTDSDSVFCARFRTYCPLKWRESGCLPFAAFLEKIESRFYLEEAWFSCEKVFPRYVSWYDDYHTIFSQYIAFSSISDLTVLMELHETDFTDYHRDKPFIQVHLLGKDVEEMKRIMDVILQETKLEDVCKDKSSLFGRMELE